MLELIIVFILLYLFAIRCRGDHPGMKDLQGWAYAHRGLHGNGRPENSMAAFQAALEGGYGIELDIHLLADGNLAVIHDSLLKRTTGAEGRVEDLTVEDLKNYHLEGTDETIPEFSQVLDLYAGKAPLIIELKPVDGNHAQLAQTACAYMEGYKGPWCIESFDPRCLEWLRSNRPDIIRGQLSYDYSTSKSSLPGWLQFCLSHYLLNFRTVPDFVAHRFDHRKTTISTELCRRVWKAQGVSWTIRNQQDFDIAKAEGWLPIFENFVP